MRFITVAQFKQEAGINNIKAVLSPKTGKKFLDCDGVTYRMEQKFDSTLPHKFMIGDGETIEDACLVNIKEQDNTLFTL